jgi:carbonic anhydrase
MKTKRFAAVVNCMDGRVQEPVNDYIKSNYQIDYVDVVTEPGPNKILADNANEAIISSIKKRLDISVNCHKANLIAIAGHYDCAGNPSDKEKQIEHVNKAIELLKNWEYDLEIIGLWVNERWEVEKIS